MLFQYRNKSIVLKIHLILTATDQKDHRLAIQSALDYFFSFFTNVFVLYFYFTALRRPTRWSQDRNTITF